jgi:aminoacyl tRNA synthase complex-interacting multifunctional protein 1
MSNIESHAINAQWSSLAPHVADHIPELNDTLKVNTFITGTSIADIDSIIFKSVFPLANEWIKSPELIASHRHILRWIDLLQNTVDDLSINSKLIIDLNIQLPREIKEKPKKKDTTTVVVEESENKKNTPVLTKDDKKNTNSQPLKGKPTTPEAIAAAKAAKEAKKAAKAKANAEAQAKSKAEQIPPNPSMIDIRVGFIEKAIKHPDADSLYVSTIQMGDEDGPRTVCSGLVKHFSLEEMQKRYVITIANLKPVTMRGIKSSAMVLCAANPDGKVEFVNPPEGSQPGDKIFFEGFDGIPEKVLNPKKKIWESVQPHWTTTDDFTVVYKQEGKPDSKLVNKKGQLCQCSTIVGAEVR